MQNSKFKIFIIFGLTFFNLLLFSKAAGAAGTLYFSPASGSYATGGTLQTSVMVNTGGDAVNAVSAYFSYPTDLLDFAWISESGSSLTIWAEKVGGGGTVKLAGGLPTPGFSGRGLVATVGFKVKKTGQANLAFISGSHVLKDSDNSDILNLGGSGRASFSLTTPQPTQPAPTPTPPDETPPIISEIRVVGITENQVTVFWKTDEEADSLVEYGIEPGSCPISISQKEKVREHRISLLGLAAGTTFYFRVTSQDVVGNIQRSREQSFTTLSVLPPSPPSKPSSQKAGLWFLIILLLVMVAVALLANHKTHWFDKLRQKNYSLTTKNESVYSDYNQELEKK